MSQVPDTPFTAPPPLDAVIAEPADASALLQKRLELTARAMRLLQSQLSRADDRLTALQSRNDSLESACTRAEQLARALDARADEPPASHVPKPRAPSRGFFSPPAPDTQDAIPDAPRPSSEEPRPSGSGHAPSLAHTASNSLNRESPRSDPDPPPPPENPDHALHTLIDDLVARCAILERERAEASIAERALLAGLHDELRDGLADLSTSLTALSTSKLDERQHSLLDPALVSIGALADLVTGLRDLSPAPSAATGANSGATAHTTAGASSPDSQSPSSNSPTFDLRAAIDGIAEFLSRRASERNIELVCSIAPDVPPLVAGDRARLRQVVLHVVSAAVHVAHHGRVTLTISVDSLAEDHVVVRTTVAHEGTGLDPAFLEPTNSATLSILPAAAAPGLEAPAAARPIDVAGLAAARQLIERMGGRLGVESEQNARFTIWFTLTWPRPDRTSGSRRAENRLRVEAVESSVGPVLDLSLGGARVTSKKRLSGRIQIEIRDANDAASAARATKPAPISRAPHDYAPAANPTPGNSVTLQADVAWSRRAGWRRFESGLRFVDITPDTARRLTRLSMEHRVRALLGDKS